MVCTLITKNGSDNWCEDHGFPHDYHYREYAIDPGEKGQRFRELWDKQKNGGQHVDKPLPNLLQRTGNYLSTLAEHVTGGSRVVPLYISDARWKGCEPCEFRNRQMNSCSVCGCPLNADNALGDKLSWSVSKCPKGKWSNYLHQEDFPVNGSWSDAPGVWDTFRKLIDQEKIRLKREPLPVGDGDGIVVVGGGKYFASAYAVIRLIRHHGCNLPIELWYLGRDNEMPIKWQEAITPLGVRCVDADAVREMKPFRRLNGWELKFFAAAHNGFRRFISLDADCFPMRDPSFIFSDPNFLGSGAIFQRDCGDFEFIKEEVLDMFGIPRQKAWDLESGAFAVDKSRWGYALGMALFLNNFSDLTYKVIYGDKTTPALASLITGQPISVPHHAPDGGGLSGWGLMQKWFDGSNMWQHRIHLKPSLIETQFISPQNLSPKQRRELTAGLDWTNEINIYLNELRKLI